MAKCTAAKNVKLLWRREFFFSQLFNIQLEDLKMHLVRSNFEFESSGSAEISNLYVKFVKDLNCELNNGIVGRKVCNFRNSRI